jgi:hypothetical protein
MKQFLFLMILFFGKFAYADGLDEIRIYVNQKLVATTYEGASQTLELNVSVGDTLRFEISTEWGGTDQSSISVFDHQSSEKIAELTRTVTESSFRQLVTPGLMDSEMLYVFNFNPQVNRTWKFVRIILKSENR